MNIRTHWNIYPEPYVTYEIEIIEDEVILKHWFDSSRDPTKFSTGKDGFEKSSLANMICGRLGDS